MTPVSELPVALVLVSHSKPLAEATATIARQMTGKGVNIFTPSGAGADGDELGTDATRIVEALNKANGPKGTLVLMDLGSAILSAETALDLLEPSVKARVTLVGAPFVEGTVAAAVAAAAGLSLDQVAKEAQCALDPKLTQLATTDATDAPSTPHPGEASPEPGDKEFTAEAIIRDPHGLHARPAAQLAVVAGGFDAELTVRDLDNGKGPVSARSLVALGSLGARANHRLLVVGRGRDAERAVSSLASLIRSFTAAEGAAPPLRPSPAAGSGRAIPASPGIALGNVVALARALPSIPDTPIEDVDAELERLHRAVGTVRHDLATRSSSGPGADILAVQDVFLQDPQLIGMATGLIREERRNAADAFARAGDAAASVYAALEDPVLRAREADLRDVVDTVLRELLGLHGVDLPKGAPAVLIATDLPPSVAHSLDPATILGVIDRRGGPTSHAAILLRGLGIPAIVGAEALIPSKSPSTVAFDGTTGEVIFDPTSADRAAFDRRREAEAAARRQVEIRNGVVKTLDGTPIELWANVTGVKDARAAYAAGAMGIGLLRTEVMFLDRADPPTEDEQVQALKGIFDVFGDRPITVRTLDAGGDKPVPYMNMAVEANPFLGVRGLRLSLRETALFETQLRAILTAAKDRNVAIMLPMVTEPGEVVAARAALERAHAELQASGIAHAWPVPLGIMVEVPAAALDAEVLAESVDFFSIGTNDLTQYALAAERGHPGLGAFADAAHPAVLRLVETTARAGAAREHHVAVCGEAAGDPIAAQLLVGAGIHALSMSAGALPRVAAALAGATLSELEAKTRQAMRLGSAPEARAALHSV